MHEEETTINILALRPGRREMGVAVLEVRSAGQGRMPSAGEELVFWGVTGFRGLVGKALLEAVERRVMELIQQYEPAVVAIEEPSGVRLRMSPMLGEIVRVIRAVAVDAGVRFVAVSPAEVRKRVCGSERATHAEVVGKIVERYPGLGRYRRRSGPKAQQAGYRASRQQEDYWRPMFSAVGVGVSISPCGKAPRK